MTVATATVSRAAELLAALGSTKEEVAATLAGAGIAGRRNDCRACPVALYLLKSDLAVDRVYVGDEEVELWFVDENNNDVYERIDLPEPVAQWVTSFDAGQYDELADRRGVA